MSTKKNTVFNNALWLSVVHFSSYIIPLLEVPILARALGAEAYGSVVVAISMALMMSIFVEFGFNISAARAVACKSPSEHGSIIGNVLAAKFVLFLLATCIVAPVAWFSAFESTLIAPALLYFFAFAFSPFWYFQGVQQMILPAMINFFMRVLSLLLIFLIVTEPADAVLALYILALCGLTNTLVTMVMMWVKVTSVTFTLAGLRGKLAEGWHAFLYRSSGDMIGTLSPLVLGATAGPYAVGMYTPADKIVRAVASLQTPVLMAFFPYLSKVIHDSRRESFLLVGSVVGASLVIALSLYFLIPYVIVLFVGEGFADAIVLAKYLLLIIPLRMFNQSIVMAVFMPSGKDRVAGYPMALAVLWVASAGYVLASGFGALGMVWALISCEFFLAVYFLILARRLT
ncbi:hypothetical protein BVH03_02550 [Pseudomonas sp. PA15(2017)]|uniref:oligosaccharide flippase family protein n=1 Tax=Pseudomonas sp. PA15(2017) TaxID=1932111 RepID=UPI000969036C|nr:oligosaccharide flippase family protein [Pseudomonas sp. PA15(2017)]OLU34311.1 hypothetical protein BVH03_02550 [Pseudomonas sp. PA15(2017)]